MILLRRSPTSSIAGRLLLFSGAFVTLALVVASVVLWLALRSVIRDQIDQRLDTQIAALATALSLDQDGKLQLAGTLDGPLFDRPGSGWYWQVEGKGQKLVSRSLLNGSIDAPPPKQDFIQILTAQPTSGSGDSRGGKLYLRQSIQNLDGTPVLITVSAPRDALAEPAFRALLWLVPSMLLLGMVLLVGTFWQIRFGLRPLRAMAADVEKINRGERSRLQSQLIVELSPLAEQTNALLESNEERLAATRLQFANLAHGLKTPVASLLLALNDRIDPEGTLRTLATRIDNRIKHHLRAARRVMAGRATSARCAVSTVVEDVNAAMRAIYAEKGIAWTATISEGLCVACEVEDMEEMLGNLMDNAYKWAASKVSLVAEVQDRLARLTIEDNGPGLREDRLEAVLLPGVREDERVPGDGFGLTIVAELASLYGGTFEIKSVAQRGTRAILHLPRAVQPTR